MQVSLGSELIIPCIDLGPHPGSEGVAEDGVRHVADPLLRHLLHLARIGKVSERLRMVIHELIELRDGQRLILWNL